MNQKKKIAERERTIKQQGEKISDQVKTLLIQNAEINENAGQIREQTERLEELSLKVEDVETLIQDVSEVAYDKAVDIVTEKVREQTRQEDISVVADYKKKLNLPDARVSPKVLPTVNKVLDNVQLALKNAAKQIQKKIDSALKTPGVRNDGVEQVKQKARESVYDALKRGKIKADQQKEERRARQSSRQTRKKNMEI